MTNSQEQALIKIYKAMASGEIERRLATSGLTQLARGVAENELMQRRLRAAAGPAANVKPKPAAAVPPQALPRSYNPAAVVFLTLAAVLLLGAGWIFTPHLLPLFGVISALLIALGLGKAFPLFGMTLGGLSFAGAIAIPVAGFLYPATDPAENFLRFFFGAFAVALLLAVGAALVHGARVARRDRKFAACMAKPGYTGFEDDWE